MSDPKSVLAACQTNAKYRNVCKRPDTFFKLMKAHYPQFDLTSNPRRQYTMIASGIGTDYTVPIFNVHDRWINEWGNMVYTHYDFDRYAIPTIPTEPSGLINFKILGAQPKPISVYTLFIRHDKHGLSDPVVYRNLDDAIDDFFENEYSDYVYHLMDLSEVFQDHNPGIETAITDQNFIDWLDGNEYPQDLSPGKLREYIADNRVLTYWTSVVDPELTVELYFPQVIIS